MSAAQGRVPGKEQAMPRTTSGRHGRRGPGAPGQRPRRVDRRTVRRGAQGHSRDRGCCGGRRIFCGSVSRSDTESKAEGTEQGRWERTCPRSLDRPNGGAGLHSPGAAQSTPTTISRRSTTGALSCRWRPTSVPAAAPVLPLERCHPTLRGVGRMRKATPRVP
jgi:hypothetical protein